jgi:hypothetical protein
VAGDRTPGAHQWINHTFREIGRPVAHTARTKLLSRYVVGSIKEANEKRLSLAILQPDSIELNFEENAAQGDSPQLVLFDAGQDEETRGARRFQLMPRVRFRDEHGPHNLMLRDWGSFELQRKHGGSYFRQNLETALNLTPASSLLVGNMNNQRTTWLVISVLNGIRDEQETLFDAFPTDDSSIPGSLREAILSRDGGRCERCGKVSQITIIRQRSSSVPHSGDRLDDFKTVCKSCIRIS